MINLNPNLALVAKLNIFKVVFCCCWLNQYAVARFRRFSKRSAIKSFPHFKEKKYACKVSQTLSSHAWVQQSREFRDGTSKSIKLIANFTIKIKTGQWTCTKFDSYCNVKIKFDTNTLLFHCTFLILNILPKDELI